MAGATVNINADGTVGRASIESGTLGGSGTITATEVMTWTGGTLGGSGRTVANGQMVIEGASVKTLNARTLVVAGVGTWRAGSLYTGNGAQIIVPMGGSFDIQTNATLSHNQGGVRTQFHNQGTLVKSAGNGATQLNSTFVNTGTVDIITGTLWLNAGYVQAPAGVLKTEISGLSTLGKVDVTGSATLSGTFALSLTNGYAPDVGDTFAVMTFDSHSDQFARFEGLDIGNGRGSNPIIPTPTSCLQSFQMRWRQR